MKKFFAYLICLFSFKALAEAVNNVASVDELDCNVLEMAGFNYD